MSVRMRMTKSKTGLRRSHHGVKNLSHSKNEDGVTKSHRVSVDGKYKGRVIIDMSKREERIMKRKADKKAKKQQNDVTNNENKTKENEVIAAKNNTEGELKI